MKRQDTRAKGNGKKCMRILAVTLSVSVLFTTCPDLPETFSVLAAEEAGESETETRYVSAFAALPDEVKEQTVPVGTALSELSLPDTLEAVVTGQPSEDTAGKPEDDGEEDSGENDGETGGEEPPAEDDGEEDSGENAGETGGEEPPAEDDGEEDSGENAGETGGEEPPAEDDGEEDAGENAGAENGNGQETHTVTLPEYYAENVISVQILENTWEEKREETVTIGGVTWQSAPAYDGDTEGTYLFTAALPDEYAPAEGVSLPRITVTVRAERRRVMAAKAGARAEIVGGSVGAGWTLDTDGKLTFYSDAGMSGWITAYTNSKWYDRVISLEVKNGVTRLADGCVSNCNNLKSVKLPETLEEIGVGAFQACKSLAGIEIPASVTKIGPIAFMNCSSLESVKMLGATPPELVKGMEGFDIEWYFIGTKFYGKTGGIYVPLGSAEAYKSAWFVSQFDDYRNNIVGAPLVTYDYATNGGTSATKTAMFVEQNTKVDLTPSATKKDWEFVGWHTDKNATTKLTSHTIGTANITLYAIYEKKLTLTCYSGNGSSETKTAVVYNNGTTGKVSLPAGESLSGYAFDGYVGTAGAFSGDVYQAGAEYTLSADTSLYGLYTKTITVSYDANGGKGSVAAQTLSRHANVSSTVAYETAPTVSLSGGAALSRDGYKFKGWLKDSGTGTSVTAAGTSVTVEKDTTYYAKWEVVSYKITYQLNGGKVTGNPADYTVESEAITLKNPTREGYFFTGWSGTGLTGSANTKVTIAKGSTGDRAYTAKWNPVTYTITYQLDGGTASGNPTKYTIESEAITLKNPTKTGYTFAGWSGDGLTGSENENVTIAAGSTGNRTYTAHWIAAYGVTLHGNGGSGTNLTFYTEGRGAALPGDWTRRGYSFGGWYDNADCGGEKVTQILTTDTGEKEYWAKWIDDIAPVIGDLQYSYEPKNLWHWLIGKDSLVITVPVTEEGSGADEITYSMTPEDGGTETKSAAIENGAAEITIAPVFKGTIAITCTDKAGNTSAGVTVGADLNADGVIIEDHAPEITVLADRGTSDTEPTQPDGVAVSGGYYVVPPALPVSVKDDMEHAVTGGLSAITYQIGDGAAKTVTFDRSTLQEAAQAAFTIPAEEIPTGVTEITVTATDNAGNKTVKTLIIRVKGPEEKPAAVIAYREEKLTYLVPGAAYLIDGKPYTADEEGGIPIAEGWFGSTVSIIKQGNDIETTDSPAQSLPIPARPPKPAPTGVDVDTPGGTGKLTDLTAGTAYEVSADGGKTWTSKTADENGVITRLAPGIYLVRVEAGVSSFASKSSDPAAIGAYQMKVTFVANGETYREVFVDYAGTLTDIPPVPPKKDAGEQLYDGAWCMDEQGTAPAVFTDITVDLTVYAVYTKEFTVTLQTGKGYTLSAETGSESPVREGGSFAFRFAMENGYQKTRHFAVKVNGVKVELTAEEPYTYTIADIRENQIVTVEGVVKKPDDKDKEHDPEPDIPVPEPEDAGPDQPIPSGNLSVKPTPPAPGTTNPVEKEPAGGQPGSTPGQEATAEPGDRPGTTPRPQPAGKPSETQKEQREAAGAQTVVVSADNGRLVLSGEPVATGNVKGMTDTSTVLALRNGAVIVTVVCEEQECTAGVADSIAVADAVLTPEQIQLVGDGETIEIRIDVKDISEKVPAQDKEVIERGMEAYREAAPGLVLGMYVDISMFIKIGAGDWNAVTATDAPVEVVIGIPEKLLSDGREFTIIRAHNGEYAFMNDLDGAPDTITISTELFSSYAIAYAQTEGAGADGKCGLCHICPTFLGICCFVWLAVILLIMVVLFVLLRKKKEEEEE